MFSPTEVAIIILSGGCCEGVGEGVGTGLGGQLPAACRGVDIAVDIDCSHLTMTQKCGRWLKVCSLGKLLLDTVSSNVWSTQAARQGFTSPLSTI